MAGSQGLDRYRDMRDFESTAEPRGADVLSDRKLAEGDTARFVIQQHDATRLHWDLRLEAEGVLWSWAVPRGLPWSPDENHLAVHTEDHPLEYLDFEGDIPQGEYGGGNMFVWDRGTYEAEKVTPTKLTIVLRGERVSGRYALFRTRGRDWMVHRMDPPEDPGRKPLPEHQPLMEAVPGPLPDDDRNWAYEVLWRGERALVTSSGGAVAISDRAGRDISRAFPEIRRLGRMVGSTEVMLDGVIVSAAGEPEQVRKRLAAKSDSTIRRLAKDEPAVFLAFDLMWVDGHSVTRRKWSHRRELLEALSLEGPAWKTPSVHRRDGDALLAAAAEQGLAGLVAKRVDSRYEPAATAHAAGTDGDGGDSASWVRIATAG